jgi:hypothetical protein
MFIVPYIYKKVKLSDSLIIYNIEILCEGGKTLWIEDDNTPLTEILEPNGLYISSKKQIDKCILLKIDTGQTDMSSMYKYAEISIHDSDTLCWKTNIMISNINGTEWLPFPEGELKHISYVILKTECVI